MVSPPDQQNNSNLLRHTDKKQHLTSGNVPGAPGAGDSGCAGR